ncbi:MAG: PAS domain-containing protein [Gemmatimonadetes bacterium]|nr:PAS domain-containing protein [Gemmatimonadota bacterium]
MQDQLTPWLTAEGTALPSLLETFFERSRDGFFFMMLDEPVEWSDAVDKEAVLDHVFAHQRMSRVNTAMAEQFGTTAEQLLGKTPRELFAHDVAAGRRGWRALFDAGHSHSVTYERRADGTPFWVEGDYMCLYDAEGRITGHCGVQRDVTDRTLAAAELERSRAELRALSARIQEAREEERTRIAREIHDVLGQALTALKLDLSWLEDRLGAEVVHGFLAGRSISSRIDETMEIVRRLASELRPSVLDQLGLDAAIEWLVRDSAKRTGIAVTLQMDEVPPLPAEIASNAFRIIQEALTNVSRHSKATLVHVSLRRMVGRILLTVEDNGVGIEPQSLSGLRSMGMVGMRERAVACGGTLMVSGEPGHTSIVVTIPVPAA